MPQLVSVGRLMGPRGGGPSYEAETQAYINRITAAGGSISTDTKGYTDTLVIALKDAGLWDKLTVYYPFAGDNLTTALIPLKAPAGVTSATNFNFVSGDYSESSGLKGDGSTKYLDLGIEGDDITDNDVSMGVYIHTAPTGTVAHISCDNSDSSLVTIYTSATTIFWDCNNNSFARCTNLHGGRTGLIAASRTAVNASNTYKNGVAGTGITTGGGVKPGAGTPVLLFKRDSSASFGDNSRINMAHVSSGLTDAECSDLYDAVQAFNTSLGRAV